MMKKTLNQTAEIRRLLKSPPVQWPAMVDRILKRAAPFEAGSLARAMEDDAGRLAFLAEYVAQRCGDAAGGSEQEHKTAAKRARGRCLKVNRALGYSYPERRVFNL